jgi:chorismate synthase
MNTFGNIFKVSVFGESHGPCVGITLDGVPAGMPLDISDFLSDLERRKGGLQKGTTPARKMIFPYFKVDFITAILPVHH